MRNEFQFGEHKTKLVLAKDITEQLRAEAQVCQLNESWKERVSDANGRTEGGKQRTGGVLIFRLP